MSERERELEARAAALEKALRYIANGVDNPRAVAHEALASGSEKQQ